MLREIILSIFKKNDKTSTTKKRVAIFGGSFDPVHKGHAEITRKLCASFDRVIVVPAKISPFKLDRETADSGDRLSMLKLALADMPTAEISDYEIKSGGISYSFLTAKKFSAPDVSLFYVIGSEMIPTLSRWKNFDQLKKLVTFYIVPREGFVVSDELMADYERMGARLRLADFSCEDISSAMIKVDIAFKKASLSIDDRVLEYINRYNLYKDYAFIVDRYAEFNMKPERIEHTYSAVKVGIRLAKIHGIEVERVVKAILLHDIGKYTTKKELIKRCSNAEIPIDDKMPESCRHAPIGAFIARHCFGIEDEGIIKAIETHTCCAPFMDDLQKIVAIADYIEEGREFKGLEPIRAAALTDLDLCMELMLKNTIDHLKGKDIYKLTYDAYDYFRMIRKVNNSNDLVD